jgi:hypothetical protein
MSAATDSTWKISHAAIAEAEALIQALSPIEPDLAAICEPLKTAPVDTFAPDRTTTAWRGLYLSLYALPRRIVLVGSIDAALELAGLVDATSELLIVETDVQTVSTAEFLPRGIQWRSLSEFGVNLDAEERFKLITALVNSLQPDATLIIGSRVGWELLSRYGKAISRYTALFAAVAASPGDSAAKLLWTYLRTCLPVLLALYGPDELALRSISNLFRLTDGEKSKLRDLRDWREDNGFLSSSWDQR